MGLPKIEEVTILESDKLDNEILNVRRELFELRLRRKTKQSFSSHKFKHAKHRLGQLLMVQKNS